ncbi:MAG: TonB-dependent receptor [Saprospiraceae bacterium]|nr:TonB-dependent receptor [Saprospiraceae bacterium]
MPLLFWVGFANAQQPSPTLSANFRDTDLRAALDFFEKRHGVSFSYDDAAIRGRRVTAQFKNLPLREAMQRTLQGTGLGFEVVDNQYVLIKKLDEIQSSSEINRTVPSQSPITNLQSPPALALCGTILDDETSEPLPGATAHIKDTPHGTTTEENGKFKLEGDFSKDDSLIISYLGYQQQAFVVRPLLVKPCQTYRLKPDLLTMPDVIISDFATDMVKLTGDGAFHFDRKKMPTLPGWGEPDVLRSLQLLPGIGSTDESGTRLFVRGGTPDQNLVLLDGIPIYHTGHFFGLYDAFNPFIVDQVEVWRGNFGAEFGGRNSSVINIGSKKDFAQKTHWGIGMNLLSLQSYVDIPLKKDRMSLLIALRRSYIDGFQSTAYQNFFKQLFQNTKVEFQEQEKRNNEFYTWNPFMSFGDANIKLRWLGKKSAENAITYFASGDRLDYAFTYDDSINYRSTKDVVDAKNTGLSWQHKAVWSPKFKVHYRAALSGFTNSVSFFYNADDRNRPYAYYYSSNNQMTEFSANFHHDWQVNERHRMSFGYQLNAQEASVIYRDTNAVEKVGNLYWRDTVRTAVHTFYAEFAYQPTERLDFTLGVRENNFPSRNLYYSEPRLSFNWFPFGKMADSQGTTFRVKGGLGRYWQFVFQTLEKGDLGVGEPFWVLADEQTPPIELWQTTIGVSWESKTWLIDLEAYGKQNRNLTSQNLQFEQGIDQFYTHDGISKANGIDFLFRKRFRNYSTWLSLSLSSVDMQFSELNGGKVFRARHDVPRRLNWVNTYSYKKWEFSANLHLRSGTPYSATPEIVQVACSNCESGIDHKLYFPSLNTQRLPDVFRLDLSATWKWQKNNNHGKIGLTIYNATDSRILLDKDYLLQSPPANQPEAPYTVREIFRFAAGATPSIFVISQW